MLFQKASFTLSILRVSMTLSNAEPISLLVRLIVQQSQSASLL